MKEAVNYAKYIPGQQQGHYESFFMRANHPTLAQAFWIRYTIFSPHQHPEKAIGELWAIYFDGITNKHTAVKSEVPFTAQNCVFARQHFFVQMGDSVLQPGVLSGHASSSGNTIAWDLKFEGNEQPLFALPENLYEGSFPKAKLLVSLPLAVFKGNLKINSQLIDINGWIGSQNHNWGVKHTDHYAWGQVAGFDNYPGSFLEVSTARLKMGPIWTPFMTLMVLRHRGREFRLNSIFQALKADGRFSYFDWKFHSKNAVVEITGSITASKKDFVGLRYYNPPGGIKHCLNTKIAACKLTVRCRSEAGEWVEDTLETTNRAAFEILTDDAGHGIELRA